MFFVYFFSVEVVKLVDVVDLKLIVEICVGLSSVFGIKSM